MYVPLRASNSNVESWQQFFARREGRLVRKMKNKGIVERHGRSRSVSVMFPTDPDIS